MCSYSCDCSLYKQPVNVRKCKILSSSCPYANTSPDVSVVRWYCDTWRYKQPQTDALPQSRIYWDYRIQDCTAGDGGTYFVTAAMYSMCWGGVFCLFVDLFSLPPLEWELPHPWFQLWWDVEQWQLNTQPPTSSTQMLHLQKPLNPRSHKPAHHSADELVLQFSVAQTHFGESLCFRWKRKRAGLSSPTWRVWWRRKSVMYFKGSQAISFPEGRGCFFKPYWW